MIRVHDNVDALRVARVTIHANLDDLAGAFMVVWFWNSDSRALFFFRFW
jgi:hypothetical protein